MESLFFYCKGCLFYADSKFKINCRVYCTLSHMHSYIPTLTFPTLLLPIAIY